MVPKCMASTDGFNWPTSRSDFPPTTTSTILESLVNGELCIEEGRSGSDRIVSRPPIPRNQVPIHK
jgi:hypothetical protein